MMDAIRQWLLAMITAAICLAVLDAMTAKGAVKQIGNVTGGLVMFLVLLQPLQLWDADMLEVTFTDFQAQIDEEIEDYTQFYDRQLAQVIEGETAAYISEKAAAIGLTCCVEVTTKLHDSVPIPHSVQINVLQNNTLAVWIEQELGIPQSRQFWEEDSDESYQNGNFDTALEEIPTRTADPVSGSGTDDTAQR